MQHAIFGELHKALPFFQKGREDAHAASAASASLEDRNGHWLAHQTMFDLELAVDGLIEFCKYAPQRYPGRYLIVVKFSQDALENFFGVVRGQGGHTAPSVQQYKDRVQKITVAANCSLVPKGTSKFGKFETQAVRRES